MNPSEPAPQFLEIPGEPTIWRTQNLPPRRVELPCLGRMPGWRMMLLLILGLPLIPLAWITLFASLVLAAFRFNDAPFEFIKLLLVFVIAVPFLALASEAVLIAIRGVFHQGHHVGFDAEKIWHFQLFDPITFNTIKRLDVFCLNAAPLTLRVTTDQPFRLQFASLFNRRKSASRGASTTHFTFSSKMLSGDTTLLIDAISHLVEAKGGVVRRREIASLWWEIFVPFL